MLSSALFIGGCDRSGTTLLGSLLGQSKDAHVTPESQFKTQAILAEGGLPRDFDPQALFEERIASAPRWPIWAGAGAELAQLGGSYGEFLLALASSHAQAHDPQAQPHTWIDHTPSNLRYAHELDRALPGLRFIHIVRDGRAICASQLSLTWGPRSPLHAAEFWKGRVAECLAVESNEAFVGRVLRVPYEDLVHDPEHVLRRCCEFAGIAFDDSMLEGGAFRAPKFSAKQHALVGAAPNPSRVDAWRDKLSAPDQRAYEWAAGSLLQGLGYECDYWPLIHRVPLRQRARYALQEHGVSAWAAKFHQRYRLRKLRRENKPSPSAEAPHALK